MRRRTVIVAVALLASGCGGTDASEAGLDDSEIEVPEVLAEVDDPVLNTDEAITIGVINLTSIAALDLLYEGFEEGIAACPIADGGINYRNAQGDGSLLRPYADELLENNVDLMLAITTPALQAATAANLEDGGETPLLFGAVTDPYTAGVATDETTKPPWMTGWRTNADVAPLFDLAAEIRDSLTTIGVVYNPDQVNSTLDVGNMQAEADARGLGLLIEPVADQTEVAKAATSLAEQGVDAFLVPNDIVVVDGLSGMSPVADKFDIPIISLAPDSVFDGAAVGIGLDYKGDGGRLADDACRILNGETTPAELPIRSQREQLVFYSPSSAADQGFTIPDWVVEQGQDIEGSTVSVAPG